MKADILSLDGKKVKSIDLPVQFTEDPRPSLMKRAVLSLTSKLIHNYGSAPLAGFRHSAKLSRRRRDYKGAYNKGISRVPRKTMTKRGTQFYWIAAEAPGTVGGRRAHPPKSYKNWTKEINKKEKKKALRSALSFSAQNNKMFIIEDNLEKLNKTKEIKMVLEKVGLNEELKRISETNTRSGRGKSRGRKRQVKVGPLFIFSSKCNTEKAVNNLQGCASTNVKSLNNKILSQGHENVRYCIWTEKAVEEMKKGGLYL